MQGMAKLSGRMQKNVNWTNWMNMAHLKTRERGVKPADGHQKLLFILPMLWIMTWVIRHASLLEDIWLNHLKTVSTLVLHHWDPCAWPFSLVEWIPPCKEMYTIPDYEWMHTVYGGCDEENPPYLPQWKKTNLAQWLENKTWWIWSRAKWLRFTTRWPRWNILWLSHCSHSSCFGCSSQLIWLRIQTVSAIQMVFRNNQCLTERVIHLIGTLQNQGNCILELLLRDTPIYWCTECNHLGLHASGESHVIWKNQMKEAFKS